MKLPRHFKLVAAITVVLSAAYAFASYVQEQDRSEKVQRNPVLSSAIEKGSFGGPEGVRLSRLPGTDAGAQICVLEPYRPEVDRIERNSEAINSLLREAKYEPSESYWAIIQFNELKNVLSLSRIAQGNIRIDSKFSNMSPRCGRVEFTIVRLGSEGAVLFDNLGRY